MKGSLVGAKRINLVYGIWEAADPKALVILVHGYGEHAGRYTHVVDAFTERGYTVCSLDHRGHGESGGVRAHVERFDYFVDDLHLFTDEVRGRFPDLPMVMLGYSMGGLIATRYALRYQHELRGLILSGAALQIGDDVSPLVKRISAVLAAVVPTAPIVVSGRGSESVLSRDPLVQEAFDADPLCYRGKLRARMGYEMLRASIDARRRGGELRLPLLVMHGADDKLTNPQGSIALYERSPSPDKTLKLWDGFRHEIFNEPEKQDVIAYTLDWLDQRVTPS